MASAVGGPELPPPLQAFIASAPTLDALLEPREYRGSGAVARQLRVATAAGGERRPAAVGAFAAALFAKVKSFPEVAAALAAAEDSPSAADADGGAALARLVQRLEPALQALRQLAHPAERQRISTQLLVECLAKLEPAVGAPDFRIDRYGLAVSPCAACPNLFACHVDHRVPVACGGATDASNLEAVQHRFNHYKRDRVIDPQLHRWQVVAQMAPHTYVTAGQLQQLVAQLEAQGKEPSYANVLALLRCTPPWSANYTSSSSDSTSGVLAVRSEAARLVAGSRQRHKWSAEEEQALVAAAAKRGLEALGRGGSGRISWAAVAADLGSGRTQLQCKDKWRQLLERPAESGEEGVAGQQSGDESEEEEERQQRQQKRQGYSFWSEEEVDAAAQLLGAVGVRLARDGLFALTARSLPSKLEAACQELWHEPLAKRLPGCTVAQVKDKCCAMASFAIQLARNKQLLCKQRRADRGLTPQQWQHIAPHLLQLAGQLPLDVAVLQLVSSEEGREEVRRFVEDPPREGEPGLPRLQDYWPPPAAQTAAGEAAVQLGPRAAAGAGRAAAGSRRQPVGQVASGSRRQAATAARKVAAATPADALTVVEAVIDLTLSDSDSVEGEQVGRMPWQAAAPQPWLGSAAVAAPGTAHAPSSSSSRSSGRSGGRSGGGGGRSGGSGSSKAAAEQAVLIEMDQQQAAPAAPPKRGYRKVTEEQREGIRQLWLRYGNRWELIRQAVERDPALCAFLEGCANKTESQKKIRYLARKWLKAAAQQAQQRAGGQPAAF